jgi:hypothetical protein
LQYDWTVSARFVDTDVDRARWRFTAQYRFTLRFQAGIEFNPGEGEIGPLANWIVLPESARYPMISLGTSSDRIGTQEGERAYYATFAKSFPSVGVAPYVSISYSESDDAINFPFGANYQIDDRFGVMGMYDGHKSHLILNYRHDNMNIGLMWIWLKRPGISVSWGF